MKGLVSGADSVLFLKGSETASLHCTLRAVVKPF